MRQDCACFMASGRERPKSMTKNYCQGQASYLARALRKFGLEAWSIPNEFPLHSGLTPCRDLCQWRRKECGHCCCCLSPAVPQGSTARRQRPSPRCSTSWATTAELDTIADSLPQAMIELRPSPSVFPTRSIMRALGCILCSARRMEAAHAI